MVLETRCDQLHRVAASRFVSLMIDNAKLQKISETTKYFLNFFRNIFKRNSQKEIESN